MRVQVFAHSCLVMCVPASHIPMHSALLSSTALFFARTALPGSAGAALASGAGVRVVAVCARAAPAPNCSAIDVTIKRIEIPREVIPEVIPPEVLPREFFVSPPWPTLCPPWHEIPPARAGLPQRPLYGRSSSSHRRRLPSLLTQACASVELLQETAPHASNVEPPRRRS